MPTPTVWRGRTLCLAILAAAFSMASAAPRAVGPNGLVDRRIPYYVLPGCDTMLDPNDKCDPTKGAIEDVPDAVGCCPIGYECKGAGNNTKCVEAAPAYDLSPGCANKLLARADCSAAGSCCPDGFDCVALGASTKKICQWTGRPIVPPSSFVPKNRPTGLGNQGAAAGRKLQQQQAQAASSPAAGGAARRLLQTSCPTACAATTATAGCSRQGPRWQAPSCKCYDQPLPSMMSAAPPAVAVDAKGAWVLASNPTQPVKIRGINWYGFNNGQQMVEGLWGGYSNCSIGDFPTVLKRIKLLGFNGLRLPFTFQDLDRAPNTRMYSTSCMVTTINEFRRALSPTYTTVPTTPNVNLTAAYLSAASCPYDRLPTATVTGSLTVVNKHVPGGQDSDTWNRFFWVVQYAVGQGFYVTIDFHFEQTNLQNDVNLFANEWARLWRDFSRLPYYSTHLAGRVMVELANEWDSFGCKWDSTAANCAVTYKQSMEAASAAIKAATPDGAIVPIIMINGAGQLGYGFNWGDGFVTDPNIINPASSISDARPYFTADRTSTSGYQISLAPHVYGQLTTGQDAANTIGDKFWSRMTKSWGSKTGCPTCSLTAAGINQFYSVAITEFGSDCDPYTSPSCADNTYLRDMAAYMNNTGTAAAPQYAHNPVNVWFWWTWNALSGVTKGLVSDVTNRKAVSQAWYTVKWYKMRWMQENLGLCPWYRPAGSCA